MKKILRSIRGSGSGDDKDKKNKSKKSKNSNQKGQNSSKDCPNSLCKAAFEGDIDKASEFIKVFGVNALDATFGKAPLHFAARGGHLQMIKFLMDEGADANILCSEGRTPLFSAIEGAHESCTNWLLNKGYCTIIQDKTSGSNLLHFAAHFGIPQCFRKIFTVFPDLISVYDNDGMMPIHIAVQDLREEVVNYICTVHPESCEAKTKKHEQTPLMLAIEKESMNIILLLLEAGCRTDAVDKNGTSVELLAKGRANTEIISLLSQWGPQNNPPVATQEKISTDLNESSSLIKEKDNSTATLEENNDSNSNQMYNFNKIRRITSSPPLLAASEDFISKQLPFGLPIASGGAATEEKSRLSDENSWGSNSEIDMQSQKEEPAWNGDLQKRLSQTFFSPIDKTQDNLFKTPNKIHDPTKEDNNKFSIGRGDNVLVDAMVKGSTEISTGDIKAPKAFLVDDENDSWSISQTSDAVNVMNENKISDADVDNKDGVTVHHKTPAIMENRPNVDEAHSTESETETWDSDAVNLKNENPIVIGSKSADDQMTVSSKESDPVRLQSGCSENREEENEASIQALQKQWNGVMKELASRNQPTEIKNDGDKKFPDKNSSLNAPEIWSSDEEDEVKSLSIPIVPTVSSQTLQVTTSEIFGEMEEFSGDEKGLGRGVEVDLLNNLSQLPTSNISKSIRESDNRNDENTDHRIFGITNQSSMPITAMVPILLEKGKKANSVEGHKDKTIQQYKDNTETISVPLSDLLHDNLDSLKKKIEKIEKKKHGNDSKKSGRKLSCPEFVSNVAKKLSLNAKSTFNRHKSDSVPDFMGVEKSSTQIEENDMVVYELLKRAKEILMSTSTAKNKKCENDKGLKMAGSTRGDDDRVSICSENSSNHSLSGKSSNDRYFHSIFHHDLDIVPTRVGFGE